MSRNVNRGVVIIAAGDPYYGSWALNLCATIKQCSNNFGEDISVTLLWQGSAKQYIEPYIGNFDKTIEIPKECTIRNGIDSLLRAKVCLYELSPYDETIYIDADVIWFPHPYGKPISKLFSICEPNNFTIGCRNKNSITDDPRLIWVTTDNLKQAHNPTDIYNLSSEFIYFKKCDEVKNYFDLAKSFFDNPGLEYNRFAGTVPDELAFQIAMFKTNIKPHKDTFLPFYWEPYHRENKQLQQLYGTDYFGYSIGGNQLSTETKFVYDSLSKNIANLYGFRNPFLAYNKKDIIKLRDAR
jgi:hypothetical protein